MEQLEGRKYSEDREQKVESSWSGREDMISHRSLTLLLGVPADPDNW